MNAYISITTDEELQDILTKIDELPELSIRERVFCSIPEEDYNKEIDKEIRGKGEKMNNKYKSFSNKNGKHHILMGEYEDDYGTVKSGSRNFKNNPVKSDEFDPWVKKYGVYVFSLDYPREEEEVEI